MPTFDVVSEVDPPLKQRRIPELILPLQAVVQLVPGFERVPACGISHIVGELQVLAQRFGEELVLIAAGSERVKYEHRWLLVKSRGS